MKTESGTDVKTTSNSYNTPAPSQMESLEMVCKKFAECRNKHELNKFSKRYACYFTVMFDDEHLALLREKLQERRNELNG